MNAQVKPEPVFTVAGFKVSGCGVYAAEIRDGSLYLTHDGRYFGSLPLDSTEVKFLSTCRVHASGYKAGSRDAKNGIAGFFHNFLMSVNIDMDEVDSRLDRLEEGR